MTWVETVRLVTRFLYRDVLLWYLRFIGFVMNVITYVLNPLIGILARYCACVAGKLKGKIEG